MTQVSYHIDGGARLHGAVPISGGKNAAMPCMAAALLTDAPCRITNVPMIDDVRLFGAILEHLGADVTVDPAANTLHLAAPGPLGDAPPDRLVANQRASFLVMGPLLARLGRAACSAPGGDGIGQRPLDVHLRGFAALGADIREVGGRHVASAAQLRGARVVLDYPSVLGTENLLLAAVLAAGHTTIVNAAAEPEVVCLASMLTAMGAQVHGAGTHTIEIDGVPALAAADHRLIPDRIETGTFAIAAAMTGGDLTLDGAQPRHLDALFSKLTDIGVHVHEDETAVRVAAADRLNASTIQAVPFPGLPTDLQALMTTLLTQADGVSVVHERVFESRLQYVGELRKLGARIHTAGSTAIVQGPTPLRGSTVRGLDIRAAAALVVAALAASGRTELRDAYHLDRGYECLDRKLRALGASIERVAPRESSA